MVDYPGKNKPDPIPSFDQYMRDRKDVDIPESMLPDVFNYIVTMRSQGFVVQEAAATLSITTMRIRNWMDAYPEFKKAYKNAERDISERMEKEAIRRATDGVLCPVVSNGRLVMDPADATKPLLVAEFSDDLLKFLLKGRMRDLYGDKLDTTNNHTLTTDGAVDELKSLISSAGKPTPTSGA